MTKRCIRFSALPDFVQKSIRASGVPLEGRSVYIVGIGEDSSEQILVLIDEDADANDKFNAENEQRKAGEAVTAAIEEAEGNANEVRADLAESVVMEFAVKCGSQDEDRETVLQDLMIDIRHLCDRYGVSFRELVRTARDTYKEEVDKTPPAKFVAESPSEDVPVAKPLSSAGSCDCAACAAEQIDEKARSPAQEHAYQLTLRTKQLLIDQMSVAYGLKPGTVKVDPKWSGRQAGEAVVAAAKEALRGSKAA